MIVDNPDRDSSFIRVAGPFWVEATIPTPVDWEADGVENSGSDEAEAYGSFVDRMIEVLRRSPVLHVGGGKTVKFWNVRPPAKTLSLSAEATSVNGDEKPVAFVFGPESGAVNLCFLASQVFFPRTGAWNDLRKALKADYDDSVWNHLAGTKSAPFEAGEHRQIAVKVIDDRGNELLVVEPLPKL